MKVILNHDEFFDNDYFEDLVPVHKREELVTVGYTEVILAASHTFSNACSPLIVHPTMQLTLEDGKLVMSEAFSLHNFYQTLRDACHLADVKRAELYRDAFTYALASVLYKTPTYTETDKARDLYDLMETRCLNRSPYKDTPHSMDVLNIEWELCQHSDFSEIFSTVYDCTDSTACVEAFVEGMEALSLDTARGIILDAIGFITFGTPPLSGDWLEFAANTCEED